MKNIFFLLALSSLTYTSFSQNKQTEKADKFFETYQYVAAVEEYLKLVESKKADHYVFKQLADSYYNVYNTKEAAKWYAKAVVKSQDGETFYRYAQTLKSQGKYQEANAQMDKFALLLPNDQRAKDHKLNPNYIPSLADKTKLFDIAETNINSKDQSDFGAVLTNDNTLYFASTRNTSNKTDKWNNQPYLDIFSSTLMPNGTLSEPQKVTELNTPYHDGPVTVSLDGNTMFFARDGHSEGVFEKDKKNKIQIGEQGLYKAIKVDGKWSSITALPFNSKNYSVSHPSLSKDGQTLYFASNMPGGLGDTDIWKVTINGSTYGKPENLGASVNTAGKEGFPFITENNVLYFASSGRQGFGGLDVFKLDLNNPTETINIGKPVNSENDDFSFSFNTTKNIGFLSSNRSGIDNIYAATPVCSAQVIAVVKDKNTGNVIKNATISILDEKKNVITVNQTDANGEVIYDINCLTSYSLQVTSNDYDPASAQVEKVKNGKTTVEITLEPVEVIVTETEVILKNIYFEFNKSNITAQGATELDKLVKVMKDYPSMEILIKSHTDSTGTATYNLNLSHQRAQSTVQYLISKGIAKDRLSGKGQGFTEPKIDCKENCNDEQDAQNRRSEFLIVKK